MAEATGAASSRFKLLNLDYARMSKRRDDNLRDAVAGGNCNRGLPQVDDNQLYFAAIIGIYGAGRIEEGQSFEEGAATARSQLPLEAGWYFDGDAGWDRGTR